MTNHLHLARLEGGSTIFNGRVTLLARPTFFHINTLARPAMGQFGSRWDNQSMSYRCACVWAMLARAKASTFSVLLLAYVDSAGRVTLFSNNFPSYQRGLRESTESSRLWREWKRVYNKAVQGLKVTMNTWGQTYIHSLGFNHDVKTWARMNDIVTFYFYTLSFWWHKQTLHFRRTIFTPRSWSFAKYIYT